MEQYSDPLQQQQHEAKKIEYVEYKNCNTAPNTRPVTTDERVRTSNNDACDDEDLRWVKQNVRWILSEISILIFWISTELVHAISKLNIQR